MGMFDSRSNAAADASRHEPSDSRARHDLAHYWRTRQDHTGPMIDHLIPNNLACFLAWAADRLSLHPNHVSIASGLTGLAGFVYALLAPTEAFVVAVLILFAFAQLSYLLDLADGQLARVTGTASDFGAFLDLGIDVPCRFLMYGSLFAFLYRHGAAVGDDALAAAALLVGFVHLLTNDARFALDLLYPARFPGGKGRKAERGLIRALRFVSGNLVGTQAGILMFLVAAASPLLCLAGFAAHAAFNLIVYLRYFQMARRRSR